MSAKTSAARREAFFVALAETGNQTVSAERARVSRSWVVQWRRRDPAFREQMDAAIAQAQERLSRALSPQAGENWQDIDGEELLLRGCNGRLVQIGRARLGQWTPRVETRFLRTLAASCNVTAACKAVGLSRESAYYRRRKWPAFAGRWDEALEIGYTRLEMVLLENGCNMLEGVAVDTDAPIPPMTVDQAIQYLSLHKRQLAGLENRRWRKRRSFEDVRANIVRKIEAIERHSAAEGKPLPDFMRGDGEA